MKTIFLFISAVIFSVNIRAQGYNVGDEASDFSLKNTDEKMVSLNQFNDSKGFIVVFTCNHCPFAKAYQDRIIELDKEFKPKGYPVIAINPNDPDIVPEDSFDEMRKRAKEKGYTFPYLFDKEQEIYKKYGATRTPHVFLLNKENGKLIVKYIGAIDDNYQDEKAVNKTYLKDAVDSLINGENPNPDFTKAIGCSIKAKS